MTHFLLPIEIADLPAGTPLQDLAIGTVFVVDGEPGHENRLVWRLPSSAVPGREAVAASASYWHASGVRFVRAEWDARDGVRLPA